MKHIKLKRQLGLAQETILLIPKLIWGLFLASIGTVMMIHANIGLFPWGTLNAGLVDVTGISFGTWSQITGLVIIILMALFKYYPGIGTLLDMFFVGYFIDLIERSGLIDYPDTLPFKLLISLVGLFILSYGMSLYMSCGLGAGPRDGLMLMVMHRSGKSVTFVKTVIEVTVMAIGLMLGGPFGIGTILLALAGGKVLSLVFKWTGYDASKVEQKSLLDLIQRTASV